MSKHILVNKYLSLREKEYFHHRYEKNLITLHHTVGGSAKSTFNSWNQDNSRVATPYIIDRAGAIYELFDPGLWAGHHGIKHNINRLDKRSIGIELCNWGPLYKKSGLIFNTYNHTYHGDVYDCGDVYRHSRYYEPYSEAQINSLVNLVNHLFKQFPTIPRDTPESKKTNVKRFKRYRGIIGHFHVRKDKSDVHPGFPWKTLVKECGLRED